MGILTSSQLTFQDLKDSYNIRISPDCIALNCDKDGKTIAEQTVEITFGTYTGEQRIETSDYVINDIPIGVSVSSVQHATSSIDGKITIKINKGTDLGGALTSSFKLSLRTRDDDFEFDKYITLIKSVIGATGAPGASGNGINTITYYYTTTTTQTAPSAGDVTSTTIPALSSTNKYLWQKEVIDFTDPSVSDKTSVILIAVYGDNGTNGTSITILNTSVTYQASSSGTDVPTGKWIDSVPLVKNGQYLWTKTIVNYSDGTSTTSYSVAYKGTDGTSYYTHVRYSKYADGTDFTDVPTDETIYIGVYSGVLASPPQTKESYVWSRYRGEDGVSSVTFTIYSPDGDTFTEDVKSITMNTYAYDGITQITTGASYQWYTLCMADSGYGWHSIYVKEDDTNWTIDQKDGPATYYKDNLKVYSVQVANVQTFKCEMRYKGKCYESYYTIKDPTDIYTSEIVTIGGNVLSSNKPYIIAYISIKKNGTEIDPLAGSIWTDQTNNPSIDGHYYRLNNNSIDIEKYTSGGWTKPDEETQSCLSYNWGSINSDNAYSKIRGNNKVILLNSDNISNYATVECTISDAQSLEILSKCQSPVYDLNDPFVSYNSPTNAKQGQMWVDISTTPYSLKVYDGSEWIAIKAYDKGSANIFISKPTTKLENGMLYNLGDMWVVGSDYQPLPYNDDGSGSSERYSKNTMLVCVQASDEYDDAHWRDANGITSLRESVKELEKYEEVMKVFDDGFYMFGAESNGVSKFYSKLASNELGFWERETGSVPNSKADLDSNRGTKVVWISNKELNTRRTTVEGSLTVKQSSDQSNPFISIGDLKIEKESNGSYSIGK